MAFRGNVKTGAANSDESLWTTVRGFCYWRVDNICKITVLHNHLNYLNKLSGTFAKSPLRMFVEDFQHKRRKLSHPKSPPVARQPSTFKSASSTLVVFSPPDSLLLSQTKKMWWFCRSFVDLCSSSSWPQFSWKSDPRCEPLTICLDV